MSVGSGQHFFMGVNSFIIFSIPGLVVYKSMIRYTY